MSIWDDPQYQPYESCASTDDSVCGPREPTFYAWRLLLGLEAEVSKCRDSLQVLSDGPSRPKEEGHDTTDEMIRRKRQNMLKVRDAVRRITTNCCTSGSSATSPLAPATTIQTTESSTQSQLAQSSYESIIHRMSPLLCCASLASTSSNSNTITMTSLRDDVEQLFYGFPILCCGPFSSLMTKGDPRTLMVLCHFYRATRILLSPGRCWWAYMRSCTMERLILGELESRHIDMSWCDVGLA